jgi:hypothetical protein
LADELKNGAGIEGVALSDPERVVSVVMGFLAKQVQALRR